MDGVGAVVARAGSAEARLLAIAARECDHVTLGSGDTLSFQTMEQVLAEEASRVGFSRPEGEPGGPGRGQSRNSLKTKPAAFRVLWQPAQSAAALASRLPFFVFASNTW